MFQKPRQFHYGPRPSSWWQKQDNIIGVILIIGSILGLIAMFAGAAYVDYARGLL